MNIKERIAAPCPPFFKKLRKIGLLIAATSAALLTAPIALPALIVKVAGYAAVAGGMVSAVSQATSYEGEKGGEDAN